MTIQLLKRISIILFLGLTLNLFTACGVAAEQSAEAKATAAPVQPTIAVFDMAVFGDAKHIDLNEANGLVQISKAGDYVLTGQMTGQVVVDTPDAENVKIILCGAEIRNEGDACLYVKNAKKTVLASAEGTVNTLVSTGEFRMPDANNVDATVFSQDDLNLNGEGVINIESERGHGVVSKDELKVKDGTVNITAYKKGACGKDALTLEGGTMNVEARTHALYSEGDINITGGEFILASSEKDGMQSYANIIIAGGRTTVTRSTEGIEGLTITISGGEVDITASDDGINASSALNDNSSQWQIGGNPFLTDDGAAITVSGGIVRIHSGADGIDSNGSFNMTGGELYIDGPETGAEGAIDYASEAIISGGSVVATGTAEMAEGFGPNSTQGNILFNADRSFEGGTEVTLSDEEGNVLLSFTPEKRFGSVVLSCAGLEVGRTYTLTIGDVQTEIYMTGICYSTGGRGHEMMPEPENRRPGEPEGPGGERPPEPPEKPDQNKPFQ